MYIISTLKITKPYDYLKLPIYHVKELLLTHVSKSIIYYRHFYKTIKVLTFFPFLNLETAMT